MSTQPDQVGQTASHATSGNLVLTLLAAMGACLVGAATWAGVTYIFLSKTGALLIGLGSFIAAWIVGLAMRKVAGQVTRREQAIAAGFSVLAAIGGIIGLMMLSTGKSLPVLFSEAERQATYNTMFDFWQLVSWAIAGGCGWYFAQRNA